jgi:D-arabinose 1-dehydrogenase-like Zn-dependent alcohol dehydrogenase
VKFGKAFGLNVTVLSTSISKREEALTLLGADKFVISSDQDQMAVKYTGLLKVDYYPLDFVELMVMSSIFFCRPCLSHWTS